jgi:hypothetical protein
MKHVFAPIQHAQPLAIVFAIAQTDRALQLRLSLHCTSKSEAAKLIQILSDAFEERGVRENGSGFRDWMFDCFAGMKPDDHHKPDRNHNPSNQYAITEYHSRHPGWLD